MYCRTRTNMPPRGPPITPIFCRVWRHVARSYALHLRETSVSQMLRQDLTAGRPLTPALLKELGDLLDADVANQSNRGRVLEMRRLYKENPEAFVRRYLIPITPPNSPGPYSVDLPSTG